MYNMCVCICALISTAVCFHACMYVCMYVCMKNVCVYLSTDVWIYCTYACKYVYFNEWRSIRVLVRLGLVSLIS